MNAPDPHPRRFEDAWRERFREFAEDSDDDAGIAGWTPTGLDARVRTFLNVWPSGIRGETWLDGGCGAGTYSRLLGDCGAWVIGADYSPIAVAKARQRSGDRVSYVVADVRRLPFRAEAFQGVVCFGVTQALSESTTAIQELTPLVRAGGVLWIDALNRWCIVHAVGTIWRKLKGRPLHLRYESPGTITGLLVAAGLRDIKVHWMPILPARWQRWQPWVETRFARALLRRVPFLGLVCCHAFLVEGRRPGRTA